MKKQGHRSKQYDIERADGRYEVWYSDPQTGDEMIAGRSDYPDGGKVMRDLSRFGISKSWIVYRQAREQVQQPKL